VSRSGPETANNGEAKARVFLNKKKMAGKSKRRKVDHRSSEAEDSCSEEEVAPPSVEIPSLRRLARRCVRCVDVEALSAGDCAELADEARGAAETVDRLVAEAERLKLESKTIWDAKWKSWHRVRTEYDAMSSPQPRTKRARREALLSSEKLAELLEDEMPEVAGMIEEADFSAWNLWTAVETKRRKLQRRRDQDAAAAPYEAQLADLARSQAHVDAELAAAAATLATLSARLASEKKLAYRQRRWILNTGAPLSREQSEKIDKFAAWFRDCRDADIRAKGDYDVARGRHRQKHPVLPVLVDRIACCFCSEPLKPTSKAPRVPVALQCINEDCRAFEIPFYRPGLRFCHMREMHLARDGKPLARDAGFW